jgi:hypothetical protein
VISSRRVSWAGHATRKKNLERRAQFLSEYLKERYLLGYVRKDGRIILKYIFYKERGSVDRTWLAEDKIHWRAFMNAKTNVTYLLTELSPS